MVTYIRMFVDRLRNTYWFIPATMVLIAIFLSVATVQIDQLTENNISWIVNIIYVDSAEGAREVLSTIASSMITVAGVVFSITMVVLSLTSQQFGPLVLIHFLRDRGNQLVLGTFVSTFVYCLLVLRTIRGSDGITFVPHISVLIGVGMALASLGVLIYFIHHVATTIQPSHILATLASTLKNAIETYFSAESTPPDAYLPTVIFDVNDLSEAGYPSLVLRAPQGGYIGIVHKKYLIEYATKCQCVIKLECEIGKFVTEDEPLATVWVTGTVPVSEETVQKELRSALLIGSSRTQTGDIAFMFVQLVEIAVRSLSPSLNDPFTAMMCIDRLRQALILLASRNEPSPYYFDERDNLRLIVPVITLSDMIELSYSQIIDYAKNDAEVLRHLLNTLFELKKHTDKSTDLDTLQHNITLVKDKLEMFERT